MAKTSARPGEFELIERYFRPLATDPGAFNLTDDAALYRQRPGDDLVITADMVVSGIHFLPGDPPDAIGRKALRVNLSDLAAKGAEPFGYVLSLGLPDDWTEAWVRGFTKGLAADQALFSVSLLGGDTTRSDGGVTVAITAIGRVPKGKLVRRSGARAGHAVLVSGTIGDAALGLRVHRGELRTSVSGDRRLLARYLTPQPRTALAAALRDHASAAIDVSDGLVGDLAHICAQSGVGAEINAALVPLSPAAAGALKREPTLLSVILNGGDDYEIVAAVPEPAVPAFTHQAENAGVPVTRIGSIVAGAGYPVVRNAAGEAIRLTSGSHTHF